MMTMIIMIVIIVFIIIPITNIYTNIYIIIITTMITTIMITTTTQSRADWKLISTTWLHQLPALLRQVRMILT